MKKNYIFLVILGLARMDSMFSGVDSWYFDKQVLVTGGAGFIGSHLVDALVRAGARVRVLDNLCNGTLANLAGVRRRIEFMHADILDFDACITALKNCDVVFHCAALISVAESVKNPKKCYEINVRGTYNLLEAARLQKVARFVLSSSAAVYGAVEGVCNEDMSCVPVSPYGYSKLLGEQLCQSYARVYGLLTICPRYFNVYGERQNPHSPYAGVRSIFVAALREKLPITVFGDGQQTRDFVPVQQVVQANMLLAQQRFDRMHGQPVNIATGQSISLNQLLAQLKQEFSCFGQAVRYMPARSGDIKHSSADISRYQSIMRSMQLR